jgi:hypothetical protein
MVYLEEPMTAITDYIITILTFVLGYLLLLVAFDDDQTSILLWSAGFFFTGLGAFFGGTSHAFREQLGEKKNAPIWFLTMISIGIASALILAGTIQSSINPGWFRQILIAIIILSLLGYLVRIQKHREFYNVILYYAPCMVFILILKTYTSLSLDDSSSIWIILGIIIAFVGAGIQASGFSLHKHLNHNDIFHFVQMVSTYFLYEGVTRMEDTPFD